MAIKCKKCGKIFDYEIYGTIYPGGKEKEDIDCPYCGENNGYEMTSAFVRTFKLEDQEEGNNYKNTFNTDALR